MDGHWIKWKKIARKIDSREKGRDERGSQEEEGEG